MRIGSLFSGYGGLDMAVERVFPDAAPVWFCEWDEAPAKVLAHHWPDVPNLRDVTAVDWSQVEPVDIITGGYPCQPFSAAGRREGTNDERHLWPYVREAIRVLRPRYVVLENVAGHRSLGFDRVLGDMAEDRMHVWWTSVRASDVGAPHHRERLFILATPADAESGAWRVGNGDDVRVRWSSGQHSSLAGASGSSDPASVGSGERVKSFVGGVPAPTRGGSANAASDADSGGRGPGAEQPVPGTPEIASPVGSGAPVADPSDYRCERGGKARDRRAGSANNGDIRVPHTERSGWDGREVQLDRPSVVAAGNGSGIGGVEWGAYAPAVRRWEHLTRPAPAPTEPNTKGKPRLNAAFAEWMMGLPEGHVTEVDIPRTAQLKAIGNGVCPPQAVAALESLLVMGVAS